MGRVTRNELAVILRSTRGAAMYDYIAGFLFMFMGSLVVMQATLVFVGWIVTSFAARRAADAASVHIDNDPAQYCGSELRNEVWNEASMAKESDPSYRFARKLDGNTDMVETTGCHSKLGIIRAAAANVLLSFSSPFIRQAYEEGDGGNAEGMWEYLRQNLMVTFPSGASSSTLLRNFSTRNIVRVRVTFVVPCVIPFGSNLMCQDMGLIHRKLFQGNLFSTATSLGNMQEGGVSKGFVCQAEATAPITRARYKFSSEIVKAQNQWL